MIEVWPQFSERTGCILGKDNHELSTFKSLLDERDLYFEII